MSAVASSKQCAGLIYHQPQTRSRWCRLHANALLEVGLPPSQPAAATTEADSRFGKPWKVWQLFRAMQTHAFLAIEFAADQAHLALGNAERLGQEGHQVGVGFAFNRWGGEADFQAVTVQASKLIAAGLGLQVTVENQVVTVPAEIAHQIRPNSSGGMLTYTARGGIT